MLLTRAPDLRQAQHTSIIEDIRIWVDRPDANPALELRAILDAKLAAAQRLGVEYEAYGLTARNGKRLDAALEGFCTLVDASDLVSRLRLVKSPAEIVYVRQAAELADRASTRPIAWPGPAPRRATSWRPCRAPSFAAAATIRPMSSSSARAPTRCSAAISAAGGGSRRRTS